MRHHEPPQGLRNRYPIQKADAYARTQPFRAAARHTNLGQSLAKEGEIAVGSARRFPLDEPAAGPLTDRAAPRRSPSSPSPSQSPSSAEPQPRWPVLARIAEIPKQSDLGTGGAEPASRTTYRLDSPHASAPSPSHATPPPQARPLQRSGISHPTTNDTDRQARVLQAVPLPIRITVEAWRIVQPHRALIRFAAMLALMAAGGMSMVMMMGERLEPGGLPPRPPATTADHTTANEIDTQSVDLQRAIEPSTTAPDTDTTSIAPTATGPLTPVTQPLMAIESHAAPVASPYPTTSFAETPLPKAADDSLPQSTLPPAILPRAQMTEPDVAHLPGYLLETKTR